MTTWVIAVEAQQISHASSKKRRRLLYFRAALYSILTDFTLNIASYGMIEEAGTH